MRTHKPVLLMLLMPYAAKFDKKSKIIQNYRIILSHKFNLSADS